MKSMLYYAMFIFIFFTGESIDADPPGDFTLISPFNNSTGVDRQPAFHWDMSTGALSYKLQISETENFSANWVAQETNLTSTLVTLSATRKLTANYKYYWRVVAFSDWDNKGDPKSSPVWNFTTRNEAPAIPTLSSPAHGAIDVSTDPFLSWNGVGGADEYWIQISTSTSFPESPQKPKGKSLQVSLTADTTYY
jgi:hypothetical protein